MAFETHTRRAPIAVGPVLAATTHGEGKCLPTCIATKIVRSSPASSGKENGLACATTSVPRAVEKSNPTKAGTEYASQTEFRKTASAMCTTARFGAAATVEATLSTQDTLGLGIKVWHSNRF